MDGSVSEIVRSIAEIASALSNYKISTISNDRSPSRMLENFDRDLLPGGLLKLIVRLSLWPSKGHKDGR